jgi:Protein of unknown function (DUF3048) N-terminal domain/Protein of unknown function (DUF3048) C-terminal domain
MSSIRSWVSRGALVLLLAGCGSSGAVSPRATATPSAPAPALVQVENSSPARPQSGLGSADVVYEYLTEGGISRFSAIYLHAAAGRIGPIRSARLVSITLTRLYGAVLLYSGASQYVEQQIEQSGLPHFDETSAGGALFRVSARQVPHNLYTDGAHISQLLAQARARAVTWRLWPRSSALSGARAVPAFVVPISVAEQPRWTFSAAAGGYTRTEPDTGPFIDADAGKPLVAATVIVQQVTVSVAPEVEDVSGAHGVEQDVLSGGSAQVFSGGREYEATWSQRSSGPPQFTMSDGSPAPIASGLVWIELVAKGSPATPVS